MSVLAIYFGAAVAISILMYFLENKIWDYLLFVVFTGMQVFLNIHQYIHLGEAQGEYFRLDRLGFVFLTVLTFLSVPTIIHSAINATYTGESKRKRALYDSSLVMFITVMSGAVISNNVGLTWAFIEATSLCAALLIYHDRDAAALEAAWKYLFVCSIAIALAFVGILFLGIATQETDNLDLSREALMSNIHAMNPMWLKICFLFIVTGYSVKLGVAPLFTVDIDAKDAAPSPIAGMFSGALLNTGFIGIFRFYEIFAADKAMRHWMSNVLLIIGLISVFFAAVYILRVRNYKRMLAYSSVEHAGLVLIGLAAGGIGYIAVVLHLVLHALTKLSMFLQIGLVRRAYSLQSYDKMGNYFRYNPAGGLVLVAGFFCMTGLPPSGIFLSKFMTLTALFESGHWILVALIFSMLTFIFYGLAHKLFRLLFGQDTTNVSITRINPLESASQLLMLGAVVAVGMAPPQFLISFIKSAVKHMPDYSYGIF